MLFDKYRYVVVEGPIGVGKTSLARRLAEHTGAAVLLEKPEENPFSGALLSGSRPPCAAHPVVFPVSAYQRGA